MGSNWLSTQVDDADVEVQYRFERNAILALVNGVPLKVDLASVGSSDVELVVDGVRRHLSVRRVGASSYVDSVLGSTVLTELPRFPEVGHQTAPGSLVAPMPGTVVRINMETGSTVSTGTTILVLEAMKMEHSITTPSDGTVAEILVTAGQSVDVGMILAVVTEAQSEEVQP